MTQRPPQPLRLYLAYIDVTGNLPGPEAWVHAVRFEAQDAADVAWQYAQKLQPLRAFDLWVREVLSRSPYALGEARKIEVTTGGGA